MINIIGIDPSLTATGWAVGDETGTVGGDADAGDHRIEKIFDTIRLLSEVCDLAIVEGFLPHAPGNSLATVGMAHGVIRLALRINLVPYVLVQPATLKKFATGRGGATKADMRMALYQRTGADLRDDNRVDAAWLRHLGLAHFGLLPFALPKTHLDALTKITNWPALVGGAA